MKREGIVVGIGELLCDRESGRLQLGGAPADFVRHAARPGLAAGVCRHPGAMTGDDHRLLNQRNPHGTR